MRGFTYGLVFKFKSPHYFYWEDIIWILKLFLSDKHDIENKVPIFLNRPLKHFPFPSNSIVSLNKHGFNNDFSSRDKDPNKIFSEMLDFIQKDAMEKHQICRVTAKAADRLNSTFFGI